VPRAVPKGSRRYPWGKWLRRKAPFRLDRGRDYAGTDYHFSQLMRQRAKRYGGKVSIRMEVGSLLITVLKPIGDKVVFERKRTPEPTKNTHGGKRR